jgi:hypothetical protein
VQRFEEKILLLFQRFAFFFPMRNQGASIEAGGAKLMTKFEGWQHRWNNEAAY